MAQPTDNASQIAELQQMIALQARVCYMNVDRTLATWTRTALSLIVFGAVVDRYGVLLLDNHPAHVGTWLAPNPASSVGGIALVALGVFIAVAAAIRHQAYRAAWLRVYGRDETFGPWLAFPFAVMVAIAGSAIFAVLLLFVK
ncbi:MAG: hypothetical protein OJF55_000110 [Rhodanobacteraceae bacterium]|nr:MAG: hypothetical protein OJF55_000110 [Rhodanobacteraceae bacterium]